MKKIGFIGAGNMAGAIIKGIKAIEKSGFPNEYDVSIFDINSTLLEKYKESGFKTAENAKDIAKECNIIFLAVKPQKFEEILTEIKGNANTNSVYVSVAAAVSAEYICRTLGFNAKIVRVMPNTPFLMGVGATALSRGEFTSEEEFSEICGIFKSGGIVEVFDEKQMNEIIPVNGSSPAFIYYFAKGFIDYAVEHGMDYNASLNLFCQSLIGSAEMMKKSGGRIDELIKTVSSPGGTTIAGLSVFEERDFLNIIKETCEKCYMRAEELSL